MRARILLFTLAVVILVSTRLAEAQQAGKMARIGWLVAGSPSSFSNNIEAFRQGLRELGYVEKKKYHH